MSAAAVPRLINISGVFRPADGQPAGAVETVTLSIYADQEGGAPLWQETQTVALDAPGPLHAAPRRQPGRTASRPRCSAPATRSGSAPCSSGAGEVEGPRVRITSVPYALRAVRCRHARRAAGVGLPARHRTGQRDGVTAGAASVEAGVATTPGATADVVLAGTDNFLAKYVNGGADVGNSAVFESGGSVGHRHDDAARPRCT